MKLRNKKTGIIRDFIINKDKIQTANSVSCWEYSTLAELNEEWEDYEELKEYWYVSCAGKVEKATTDEDDYNESHINGHKQIGNYFETKEETEKAVEKLKAWKRLKDKGLKFGDFECDFKSGKGTLCFEIGKFKFNYDDFDLLFGGEE